MPFFFGGLSFYFLVKIGSLFGKSSPVFGPTRRSYKLTCVCSFVRSSVRLPVSNFPREWLICFFLIFCTKVQNGYAKNVTEPAFRGKILLGPIDNLGKKQAQNEVFLDFSEIGSLDFLHKCSGQGPLKGGENGFFLKKIFGFKNEFRNTIYKHAPMFLTLRL